MKKNNNTADRSAAGTAYRVSVISIIINVILSAFKFAAGIISRSGAMISDAVHSASDVFSTIIVIIGVRMADKEADDDHQYGHERFECVAAIILAAVLCATGIMIGVGGVKKIFGRGADLITPGALALAAAAVSVIVKELMYQYTVKAADRISSEALRADAWHHRSDAFSSIGSFVAIFGARLGLPILDPIAEVIICVLIVKAAVDIFIGAIRKMTDRACDEKTVSDISDIITSEEGVVSLDLLKTRLFGDKIYVEAEIGADRTLTLEEAHAIAERTHDVIEGYSEKIKHCTVHVNPK